MAKPLGDLAKVPAKQKAILAVLFCLLVVVGYYYLYYRDASRQVASLENNLAALRSKIKEQEVIAGNLKSFQEEVRRLEEQLAHLLEQLPNTAEIPSLLKSVSDLGRDSGLEFIRFAPAAEVRKEFYAEIPVSISVIGDYHSFALFADKVRHYPRIVNLSNIAFASPKAAGENRMTETISCTATTYRFLEQATAAVPSPGGKGKAQ